MSLYKEVEDPKCYDEIVNVGTSIFKSKQDFENVPASKNIQANSD